MDVAGFNRGCALLREGRPAEAEAVFRGLPPHPMVRLRLCRALLVQGRLTEGLELYEDRFTWPIGPVPLPKVPLPRWTGEPVSSLLVAPEQGLGDQIQFARYVRALPNATIAAPGSLKRLFAQLGRVIDASGPIRTSDFDAWVPMGSLGHLVGGLPIEPYLAGTGTGGGIGVAWKGSPAHINDANRSMPDGKMLLSLPGARSLHPEDTGARDMQDTADIIAGLDLVVSVDTSVVHLAGAMGKPCWVLLPALNPDWRWTLGDRTPWYPSVRIFRQEAPGDWCGVVRRVRGALDRADHDDDDAPSAASAG